MEMLRATLLALLLTLVLGAYEDGAAINMNALKQMIRDEISSGIQKEVKGFLNQMQEAEEEQENSQLDSLLTDLKETISGYEPSAKTSNAYLSFRRPAVVPHESGLMNVTTMMQEIITKERKKVAENCADLQEEGKKLSGVYTVHPKGSPPLQVYCDLTTAGGGWTVFQRRLNGSVDFYRNWLEYMSGFGDVKGEYWLGLRPLHVMTHDDLTELYIHLEDFDGSSRHARYTFFAVSSEFTDFRLDLGSFYGNAGDGMSHSRGHRFSTKDEDNDNHPNDHCATRFTGGWWYNSCYRANLNGQYQPQDSHNPRPHQGITWNYWRGDSYSLKKTVMMFRPLSFIKV